MSAHKAARGRALAMSGLRDDVSADSSSASALTPDPDNHKYLVRLLRLFTPLWYHQAWGTAAAIFLQLSRHAQV